MAKSKTSGMGSDAFFQSKPATATPTEPQTTTQVERRTFSLPAPTALLLEEIRHQTIRSGNKMTLSDIVERGIILVGTEMGLNTSSDDS